MNLIETIANFYLYQRSSMEKDIFYLIGNLTISLVLFFYSRKSVFFSLYPFVCLVLKYLKISTANSIILEYLVRTPLRFAITSYILTSMLMYITTIVLLVCTGLMIFNLSDRYSEYTNISLYNWLIAVLVGFLFFFIKKLQGFLSVIIASIYSSLFLLNGLEILIRKNIGMTSLNPLFIINTFGMVLISLSIQKRIHKTK